ncbi:MAG TPA: homocysteine S-methyltransferase family protein [Nitrososphaeraceae archaeon]|nr:homocysteine S-methyltransferase family protein [Nitrososphaeraceae archaeon]
MRQSFIDDIEKRILLFDGAMGTEIQSLSPNLNDFPDSKDGFNDGLALSRPDWIKQIHINYLQAGADCIETNTFGSNKLKLAEYGFGDRTVEVNTSAARIARQACNLFSDRSRYVIGSMGPTGYLPSSDDPDLGQKSLDDIRKAFELQAEGLILGDIDALLIETSQDILEVKLAIEASHNAIEKTKPNKRIGIIANVTLDQYGKMLLGTNIQSAYTTVCDMGIDVFGLNCSTGPIEMEPSVRWLNEQNELPILVMPNAGMPQNQGGKAVYKMTPKEIADKLEDFVVNYEHVRIIGGCCGTKPAHISELRKRLNKYEIGQRQIAAPS